MKQQSACLALSLALATTGALAAAPDAAAGAQARGAHHGMMGDGGGSMMGNTDMKDMKDMNGMKGMKEMMASCQGMMGGAGMHGSASSLHLPPGNEKLDLQMQAEMMQKMGEIAARYADRIGTAK